MYNSSSVEDILATIGEAGFKVAMQKEMQLTREMAEQFYKEHKGQDYFEELITRMTRWWSWLIHEFRYSTTSMEMFVLWKYFFDFALSKFKFCEIYIYILCEDFLSWQQQQKKSMWIMAMHA